MYKIKRSYLQFILLYWGIFEEFICTPIIYHYTSSIISRLVYCFSVRRPIWFEAILHSFSGWLILYPPIFIGLYKRRGILPSAVSLITGVIVATYNYNLYIEVIDGYTASIPSRLEHIAQAPLIFLLTTAMAVLFIPFVIIRKIISAIH